MFTSIRLFALALLAALATSDASVAQTNAQIAADWGLLGTWKNDCGAPNSPRDGELRYVVRSGKLFHDREFGDRRDSSEVILATITPDGAIELVVNFVSLKQIRQYRFVKETDGHIHAIFNRDVNTDQYTVKDGKLTANGNDVVSQVQCR